MNQEISIQERAIGLEHPVYFVADIASNHDGDLQRAKDLICLAAEAGAGAAKFQHFDADTIVSDRGFRDLRSKQSHQAMWEKSVYEVYKDASLSLDWTETLSLTCKEAGIHFFTSPYSFELVDALDQHVVAYKIGSGDITWRGIIEHIAQKCKPVMLATGASNILDVQRAVDVLLRYTRDIVLMQCNTNYTGSLDTLEHVQLNVLKTYQAMYPSLILGLSDHTPGYITVLGAITLGARVIEKHFTDDNARKGPDHGFSLNPASWKEMVERSRELEVALGTGVKRVEENEQETVVLQRRAIRAKHDLQAGHRLLETELEVLRPCPRDGLEPYYLDEIVGRDLKVNVTKGQHITWSHLA